VALELCLQLIDGAFFRLDGHIRNSQFQTFYFDLNFGLLLGSEIFPISKCKRLVFSLFRTQPVALLFVSELCLLPGAAVKRTFW
jgi:hypothetical protein